MDQRFSNKRFFHIFISLFIFLVKFCRNSLIFEPVRGNAGSKFDLVL
jgi:hypothetical protein